MAIKKKRQQSPKERKLSLIALPFMIVGTICGILTATGMGIIVWLIIALICLTIAIILVVKVMNEHKKWIAEGNPEYRYYDTETGQEVDENCNPIDPNAVSEPKAEPESKLDEPAPVRSGGETPQEKPAPQKQPETIRGADLTIFGKLLPAAGLGLLALAFLLRTIMFIRELVPYAKNGGTFWGSYILYAIRIIGPAILLAISVVALVKFFVNKQTINQGYKAMLKIAIWYAVLNIVGLVYMLTSAGLSVYNMVDLMIRDSDNWSIYLERLIDNIIIDVFYIAFAIALIIFTKIALKNNVNSMKNKVFAMLPFGIIVLTEILFMIITGVTMPEGYSAPGYFVTAVIVLLGAGSLGAIPFLVRFEKEDAAVAASAPVAAAPVYQEPKEPQDLQEPKEVKPNKKNDGDPEVKSSKKGLIIILVIILAFVLVGGGVTAAILLANKNNREKGPDDNPSSYVAPSTKSSNSSSSSKSSSKSSSSSSTVSKTPKEVMADIVTNIFGSAKYYDDNNSDYNYWYSDSGFITVVAWSELDSSYLRDAVEYVAGQLPTYLHNVDSIHYIDWGDGTNGYAQNFVSQDEQVKVELGSYYEDNVLNCQILSHFNI